MQRLVHINQRVQRSRHKLFRSPMLTLGHRHIDATALRRENIVRKLRSFNVLKAVRDQNPEISFAQVTTSPAPARAFVYKRRKGAPWSMTLDHQSQNR